MEIGEDEEDSKTFQAITWELSDNNGQKFRRKEQQFIRVNALWKSAPNKTQSNKTYLKIVCFLLAIVI